MLPALIMILAAGIFLAAARREKAEYTIPFVLLSVVAVLFPFYCLNLLRAGRIAACLLIGGTVVGSGWYIISRKRRLMTELRSVLTPAVLLYCVLSGFACFYTWNNLVGLWDELRLWAAVPKAMYATEQLQVGADALVFRIMQPYPPGMPLLVYFMTSLTPVFRQGSIFAVYGILFYTLLLPAFQNLKWKQWPLLPLLFLLTALIPCVLTSHGGDFGWFYASLFIDPILGAAAGYAFFLAWSKPFSSRFSALHFGVTLLVLTILKDSGAMFALIAAACAVAVHLAEERKWKYVPLRGILAAAPVAFGYFLWKWVLTLNGVSTNLDNYMRRLPPLSSLGALWRQLTTQPMIMLEGPFFRSNLTLTYFPCLLILMGISLYGLRRSEKKRGKATVITWLAMLGAVGIFFLGYIISYHNAEPSFQRYTGSTLICMAVFVLLQSLPMVFRELFREKKSRSRAAAAGILAVLALCSGLVLVRWKEKKWDIEYAQKHAVPAVSRILDAAEERPGEIQNVYLLISENPSSFSMAHHRTYFELLGSPVCVRNYWTETNVVGGNNTPETWTGEEMEKIADNWQNHLRKGEYDYIYLMTLNDFTTAVLKEFGVTEPAPGDVLMIGWQGNDMVLEKAELSPDALPVENVG